MASRLEDLLHPREDVLHQREREDRERDQPDDDLADWRQDRVVILLLREDVQQHGGSRLLGNAV
jgi:hypothetical protein